MLPAERNRILTALANTEPVPAAQRKEAQKVYFEESTSAATPSEKGILARDENGNRKWGRRSARVGRQRLANIGKTENGLVSVG